MTKGKLRNKKNKKNIFTIQIGDDFCSSAAFRLKADNNYSVTLK